MTTQATKTAVPVIKVGEWTWQGEYGNPRGDPALAYGQVEFAAGEGLGSALLRQAALDLMKLANAVAAAGW
jgi:hypothetical protein